MIEIIIALALWVACTAANLSVFFYSKHLWKGRGGRWHDVGGWHLLVIAETALTVLLILVLATKSR